MKGLHGIRWRCGEVRSPGLREVAASLTPPSLLATFSTSLPLELLERLRIAARQLGLCESEIAAEAIERLLEEEGF